MEFFVAGGLCIALLLLLMAIGLQIGLAFLLSGFISSVLLLGFDSSITLVGQAAYFSIASPTWTAIPLFILLGSFASNGELARRAYLGMHSATRRLPGSLLIATSFSCGLFGAVSGSSIATTAIFGRMALPEMIQIGYNKALSVGVIASAGTFASMIPPSMMMIIYALFTQQSIGALFAAGILPGLLTVLVYSALIIWMVRRNPSLAPELKSYHEEDEATQKTDDDREYSLISVWPIVLIASVVLGGLYGGFLTPTEAAAAGALSALIIGAGLGPLRDKKLLALSLHDAAKVTSMLFLINIGALFYSRILAVTGLPTQLTSALIELNLPPLAFLIGVMVIIFLLGMIMVPIGIYALTLPIVMPLLLKLGYDPIWFGVVALKLTEIGAITPPVGLNVFAIKGVIPKEHDIPIEKIYRGCMPFLLADIAVLVLIIAVPGIALWLPNLLS
ncbi:TRAP transporter large permease [Pelagibius sp. Alg239-R121]|uniref:TRAP transporter large permease n=1 Tax=Pelagibius sp. Alg239-R121 TaxID=2993448 RepID=UPI0024A6729E|nr:TRAP transporter large permease [Pelagibius sp. Alg239-R121]